MAFGAEEQHDLDVYVVPVGINYTYPAKFRKEVMINFHDPFRIKDMKDLYNINPAKALRAFNEKVEAGLKEQVIIVENPNNDWVAEQLLVMGRNNFVLPFFKWMFDSDERRQLEKTISEKINYLSGTSKESLDLLESKIRTYTDLLKKNRLNDQNIARKLDFGFIRYLSVILGLPLFIAGYIANLIPYVVPGMICNSQIKDPRFYSSVYIGIATILYLIYFPIVLILMGIFGGWPGFFLGLLVPLTGYLVLYYKEVVAERFNTFHYWLRKIRNPSLIAELVSLRKEIFDNLDKIRPEYPSAKN
jgi:hypothetical protein